MTARLHTLSRVVCVTDWPGEKEDLLLIAVSFHIAFLFLLIQYQLCLFLHSPSNARSDPWSMVVFLGSGDPFAQAHCTFVWSLNIYVFLYVC